MYFRKIYDSYYYPTHMKKYILIILILILPVGGYFGYTWYQKNHETQPLANS
jgi:hypothetical protein